ncbi:hypothetical protein OGX96_19070 [Citrobacter sp. Cpo100]|uniref:hypothetical protein n=1 Tax=Citrobacter sp. Cpo100 TaxID=2985141 RepID=UPI0025790500|nr:hypothetical protein [Citrobacter sp. Cpo100]MDM2823174.1 hypothetical protein [Citrobacter sp. Cpo100]
MKRLIIAAITCALLSGCAGELRDEAAESSNAEVLNYVTKNQTDCIDNTFSESIYQANIKEMTYRESKGAMNAQADAEAIQAAKAKCVAANKQRNEQRALEASYEHQQHEQAYQDDERLERLCEAAHPYMIGQCMRNSAVNEMVDAL